MADKIPSAAPAADWPRVVACDGEAFATVVTKIHKARAMADLVFALAATGDVESLHGATLADVLGGIFERLTQAGDALLRPAPIPSHLAACAPQLLEELRHLRDCIESGREPAMGRVNRVISKAEGGAA